MAMPSNRLLLASGDSLEAGLAPDAAPPDSLLIEDARSIVLGALLPGAAHEINNPLFAIVGLVELVIADIEPGTRTYERLGLIRASAGEIRDVVQALTAFVPAADHEGPSLLDQATRDTIQIVRRFALARDVEVEAEYPAGPVLAPGTAGELRQAAFGLVLATVRASVPGSIVRTRVSSTSEWAELAVDGADIRSESLSLMLSSVIVRKLGGVLDVTGHAGGGASFRLPAVERH